VPDAKEDGLVIRGGQSREPSSVVRNVEGALEDGDGPVLSVYVGWPEGDENDTDVIRRVCEEAGIPHGVVQVGRTSRLQEAGLRLIHEVADGEPNCHHHVYFDTPVAESQAAAFIDCLDEPIPNPTGGKRRPS
jgi:hypothetical protein